MRELSDHPSKTRALGRALAGGLEGRAVVSICGDLGAGKTEFVKGIAEGLGCSDSVTSPTFSLVHEYRTGRLPFLHMDFYRLQDERELDEIGFDDYLNEPAVCAIEWADRFPDRVPTDALWVKIRINSPNERIVEW
jgi:tRNA threonylcarbamoyladenosine biosynthesis protein TsaE